MAGRYDHNPFDEEEEVNPFADGGGRGKSSGQSKFSGGAFYTTSGSVPPATNSRLSPLPPEPADFYDRNASIDIPLDSASDLKKKEKELQSKENELRRREQELKRREDAAARAGIVLEEKNWPPFFPIIHHDIGNEIPIHLQKLQYVAFTTFLGLNVSTFTDCMEHDLGVSEEEERNFTALLTEELKQMEGETLENQRRADMALLEAKKMVSQYQKEADKCTSGMGTCEEAREKAEIALEAQRQITSMWELRARHQGWKQEL